MSVRKHILPCILQIKFSRKQYTVEGNRRIMEEIPATLSYNILDQDPQESVDRVPESPPLFTQEEEDEIIDDDDVEARISQPSSSKDEIERATLIYDNESPTKREGTRAVARQSKTSDVVIDMDQIDEEESNAQDNLNGHDEFPDEEDALLLSVAENANGKPEPMGSGLEGLEYEPELSMSCEIEIDDKMKAEELERKKLVEKFKKFKPREKIFPDVRCSEHNTIAFKLTPNYTPGDPLELNPSTCAYQWDSKFVAMPSCNENVSILRSPIVVSPTKKADNGDDSSPVKAENSEKECERENGERVQEEFKRVQVWPRILQALTNSQILCSQDFVNVCKRYCKVGGEFKALEFCMEQIMTQDERVHFIEDVVPFMKSLVLETSTIVTCPLPILKKNLNHNISLTQKQVACLLANAFFSTLPMRKFKSQMDMPSINFKELFTEEDERILVIKAQKIRCLINYFSRIQANMPLGVVTYTRKNLRHSNMPEWEKIDKGLSKLVPLLKGTIEDDGAGMLQVDFANSIIGGGVLSRGAVQEEILFVIYPELILTRLFAEKLNYNEAVIVTGCERFSKYEGYSLNFRYDGDYQDTTPYDSKGRRCTQIVAIDALYIGRPTFQYHPKHFTRELNKAYVGFCAPINSPVAVATGKWGCGAFNGDPQLKTIIQWLAASHAGRDVAMFMFDDAKCLQDILAISDALKNLKIKDVWNLLRQYHSLCCNGGKLTQPLKEFCIKYADGQAWQELQEEKSKRTPSGERKLREVPITNFYSSSSSKRQSAPPPDDATVTAITNGIDKINSPTQPSLLPGKRLREIESTGLTEQEIQQELLCDSEEPVAETAKPCEVQIDEVDSPSSSPKTSKRPKRLVDFYANDNENTG